MINIQTLKNKTSQIYRTFLLNYIKLNLQYKCFSSISNIVTDDSVKINYNINSRSIHKFNQKTGFFVCDITFDIATESFIIQHYIVDFNTGDRHMIKEVSDYVYNEESFVSSMSLLLEESYCKHLALLQ